MLLKQKLSDYGEYMSKQRKLIQKKKDRERRVQIKLQAKREELIKKRKIEKMMKEFEEEEKEKEGVKNV
jgi:hypothetical protein